MYFSPNVYKKSTAFPAPTLPKLTNVKQHYVQITLLNISQDQTVSCISYVVYLLVLLHGNYMRQAAWQSGTWPTTCSERCIGQWKERAGGFVWSLSSELCTVVCYSYETSSSEPRTYFHTEIREIALEVAWNIVKNMLKGARKNELFRLLGYYAVWDGVKLTFRN